MQKRQAAGFFSWTVFERRPIACNSEWKSKLAAHWPPVYVCLIFIHDYELHPSSSSVQCKDEAASRPASQMITLAPCLSLQSG